MNITTALSIARFAGLIVSAEVVENPYYTPCSLLSDDPEPKYFLDGLEVYQSECKVNTKTLRRHELADIEEAIIEEYRNQVYPNRITHLILPTYEKDKSICTPA